MIKVAQQINATMSTKIALDLLSASESVKSLTAVVRSSQNAWKAQEAEMKSAGDAVGATQAKYDGLGKSIESQQAKIDALKSKQSELKGNTSETAQQFLKYQQQIDGATKQLAGMQAQQDRAKQAMDYQKSGLAGLQQEYTAVAHANQAYVTRLEAEGKQQEANKTKMEGYKSSITNLNEQLSKQSAELDKIASASGKDSDAWRTQKTRVDETATSLAKAKSSMTGLQTEMDKANPSMFSRIKSAIEGTNKQAEKTPGLLHKIVEGGLITNAITSGWQRLSSSIIDTVKSGLELNEAGEKLNMTWENMGKSANDIKILSSQMSYLRSETGATGGEINNMQTTVDTMTHGVTDKTTVISAGIASIATASHKGGAGMDSLSKAMTRVVASGNLTTTNLAKLEKQAPTLGAQLAKAAGVSQDSFAKMVADGKIKSDDFMNLVYKVGTTSKGTFDQFGKTSEGAMAQMSGAWTTLKAKMTAPLFDVKNSGMQSLSGILTSPVVQQAATDLGKGLANIANRAKDILDYVSAHKKDVTGIAGDMWDIAKIAGEEVWSLFKTVIKDIAGWLNVGGSNAKTMKDPLKAIHDVLDDIVKNKSGIQTTVKVIAGLWMTKKALEFAAGLGHVYSGLKTLSETSLFTKIASNFSLLKGSGSSLGTAESGASAAASTVEKTSLGSRVVGGLGKLGGIGAGIDVTGSIVQALTSNSSQEKIKAASKGTGTTIGAGIGAALGSVIPGAGTAAGAGIGAAIGDALGSTKTVQGWAKSIKKSMDDASKGVTVKAPKLSSDTKALGDSFAKYTKALSKKLVVSFSTDPKSIARAQKSVNDTYSKMSKSVDSYYAKKEKASASDLAKLVKEGVLTQKQANEQLAKTKKSDQAAAKAKKSAYAQMAKDANAYYTKTQNIANGNTKKLQQIAQKYGTNSKKYENEKNKELLAAYKSYANRYAKDQLTNNSKITALVKNGANRQEKLLNEFNKKKSSMSLAQINSTAKNAKKEYDAAVKPAQRARDNIIRAADTRYKSTVATATREYKDTGSISKSQYNSIVGKARKQRDDTSSAAKDQYNNVTKHATNQYKNTTSAIDKQRSKTTNLQYQQMYGVSNYAATQSQNVTSHARKQANSSLKASHHQATGTNSIFSGLNGWWNKVVKFFGGKSAPTGSGNYGYTEIGSLAYANGGAVKNGMALVGEAGPELQYKPYAGTYKLLGANGPELTKVQQGDYILNANDTSKVIAGELGHVLPGYANGLGGLDGIIDGIKKTASKVWDKVSSKVGNILKKVGNPLKFFTNLAGKIFDVNSVAGVGSMAQHTSAALRDEDVKGVAGLFDRIKKLQDTVGAPSGSGVKRWRDQVKQALDANHLSTSGSMINRVLRQIATESGGNEKARQPGADPDGDGSGPALGLMQTKRGTFLANAFPGHRDIFNGYDDILAGLHYAKARYGSSLSFLGNGHGYANGGLITQPIHALVGEDGPETILPLTKTSRAWQLLGQAVTNINHNLGNGAVAESENSNTDSKIAELTSTVNQMALMMKTIIGLNADQITATKAIGTFDQKENYKQQARDLSTQKWTAF